MKHKPVEYTTVAAQPGYFEIGFDDNGIEFRHPVIAWRVPAAEGRWNPSHPVTADGDTVSSAVLCPDGRVLLRPNRYCRSIEVWRRVMHVHWNPETAPGPDRGWEAAIDAALREVDNE